MLFMGSISVLFYHRELGPNMGALYKSCDEFLWMHWLSWPLSVSAGFYFDQIEYITELAGLSFD